MSSMHLNLLPPVVEAGHVEDLVKAGETISVSSSPAGNSFAVFLTTSTDARGPRKENTDEEIPIYFASTDAAPTSERRLFITDTIVIFSTFQSLYQSRIATDSQWFQNTEALSIVRKLSIDYVNFIREYWTNLTDRTAVASPLQFTIDHYRSLFSCFSLFVILFLPEPDYEDAPVGEELMEWLNIHFIEPSTEEGDHLSSLDRPWEDENFWSYLTRATIRGLTKASVFFLKSLSDHPSEYLHDLTQVLIPLIDGQPRLQNFNAERDFAFASRRWREKVHSLRVEMDRVPEEERQDDFDNWWDRLSDIVGILEGRVDVLKRVCEELGSDWKEVCAAWGVFVDTRLRRQDLPDIVAEVLELMPPDPTVLEDMIHSALFSAQTDQALSYASQLDQWLAAHLADLMAPLSLIETDVEEESELSKRDQHILAYAEYLLSDPTLWRIALAYMYSCGNVGKERGDEVLMRVPLRLQEQKVAENQGEMEGIVGTLRDLNQICFEFQREAARRAICRIAAQSSANEQDYALAISYSISAEDWFGLGRIIDRLLEEYILSGPRVFARFATEISPSLHEIGARTGLQGVFTHRLMFVLRYSQFHRLRLQHEYRDAASDLVVLFHDDIAPKSWWAILLCDSVELLQQGPALLFSPSSAADLLKKLEEICIRTSQGSGQDYLGVLLRRLKGGGEKEALEHMKTVRLALAKYFARCAIAGFEGDVVPNL
ncbi:nucleoporin Nup85-like protein [Armillaria novae-zelandiae]|uniref:Nuclear pore complex protein Nup85 n=1 Tax=Armillaria novae-zelandiae TaxID=153914 RepID=A0AA39PQG9_9AGAR|nr:nucleoporin Nup85-like protein [Armillaria novae-zelandiae]